MPSLWGSNKQNGDAEQHGQDEQRDFGGGDNNSSNRPASSMREPTERDRLLPASPRPPHADGYLDPDDPAVSPYNLWTVRFMRYLSVLFLVITFLWWVLLLVSIFVAPPGLHTRGSGFFDFAYASLTTGILLNSLLFFAAPSLAMRVSQGILSVVLLIDVIIIVAVARIRAEEGAPGIASVVWATIIAAWCVFTDRIVAWGKREEEERLTGRPETRRTLKEWLAVLGSTIILVVFIIISVLMTATLIIRSLDAGLPMDGARIAVDSGKYEVHLACYGNSTTYPNGKKSPTVLLEAAETPLEYDFEHWAYGAMKNGTIDRYCFWDRPGYAWSDNAPSPHSAGMSADNLAEALAIQGEEGPWILVSAGYGSIVSRIFSSRDKHVAGMMLVDPLHEDLLHRIGTPGRGFVTWGWGVISPLGIRRIIGAIFAGQTRQDRVYGKQAYTGGKFLKAKLQENLVATSFSRSEVKNARTIQAPDLPLVVVSSGIKYRTDSEWADKQHDLTKITGKLLSWEVVNKAPHYVWQTLEGRSTMEKGLGELVKAYANHTKTYSPLDA